MEQEQTQQFASGAVSLSGIHHSESVTGPRCPSDSVEKTQAEGCFRSMLLTDMTDTTCPSIGERLSEPHSLLGGRLSDGPSRGARCSGSLGAWHSDQSSQSQERLDLLPEADPLGQCDLWPQRRQQLFAEPKVSSAAASCGKPSSSQGSFIEIERHPTSTLPLSRHGTFVVARSWVSRAPTSARRNKFRTKLRLYSLDPFFTAVHQPWYRLLLIVFVLYFFSWLTYGSIAFIASLFYKSNGVPGPDDDPDEAPEECVTKARYLFDYFYWSAVTMSTLGYGYFRAHCPITVGLVPVMLIHGGILDAVVFGFVFAKFSSPGNRAKTILISESLCGVMKVPGVLEIAEGNEGSTLSLSFRVVNARKHAVMHPNLEIYLVDHRPLLESGGPPCFHRISFHVQPPLTFLEFPCMVTCDFHSSTSYSDGTTPLHDLLFTMCMPGLLDSRGSAARPLRSHEPLLETLSLVAIFSAQETATGSSFEVRRTWPLSDVQWGRRFAPMLTAHSPAVSDDRDQDSLNGSLLLPEQPVETVVDMARLNCTEPF